MTIHQTKVVEGKNITTKCGMTVAKKESSVWWTEVTCRKCRPSACEELSPRDTMTTRGRRPQDTKKEEETMPRDHTLNLDKELADQVVKLRDDEGMKWNEIHEQLGIATGKLMLHYTWAKLPSKEKVKNAGPADVVRLRNEGLSWGDISIRTGINENACRSMFEESTGESTKGNRIGKGGRHPGEGEPAPKKATAKKAPAKKAAPAAKTPDLFEGLTSEQIKDRISGYAIKVNIDGAETPIKVKAVKKVASGKAIIVDADSGAARTIKLAAVSRISKAKVA